MNTIVFFVTFAALFIGVTIAVQDPEHTKCLAKYRIFVEVDAFEQFRDDDPERPRTPEQKACALSCYWELNNLILSDGSLSQAKLNGNPMPDQENFVKLWSQCQAEINNCNKMYCVLLSGWAKNSYLTPREWNVSNH